MDPDTGEPLDTLTEATRKWAKSIGSKAKTVTEVLQTHDPAVSKATISSYQYRRINSHVF